MTKLKPNELVMGIDLSLTGAGVSFLDHKGKAIHQELISTEKQNSKKNAGKTRLAIYNIAGEAIRESYIDSSQLVDMPRLVFIRDRIRELILQFKPVIIIIEGYSMNGRGRGVSGLMEIGGIIRMTIYDLGISYLQCPPLNAKAYISGLSTANKDMVISSIYDRFGIEIEDDNIADSYCLAMMYVEFGDGIQQYIEKGGIELLRSLKLAEIRSKPNKVEVFSKILNIGEIIVDDFNEAVKQIKTEDIKLISSTLQIAEEFVLKLMSPKPSLNKLNDSYRFKKKSKKKKNLKLLL